MRKRTFALTVEEERKREVIDKYRSGILTRKQAAELLGLSARQVTRLRRAVEALGERGLIHGNAGREPVNKTSKELSKQLIELAQDKYFDTNFIHLAELLQEREKIEVKYATLRRICIENGIAKHHKKSSRRRRHQRQRMPQEGLLVQMDGSHHKWNGRDEWVLIGVIDDATSDTNHRN